MCLYQRQCDRMARLFAQYFVICYQLAESSLKIPEVRGANPVISNFYTEALSTVYCIEGTKIKKNETVNGPFKKVEQGRVMNNGIGPLSKLHRR